MALSKKAAKLIAGQINSLSVAQRLAVEAAARGDVNDFTLWFKQEARAEVELAALGVPVVGVKYAQYKVDAIGTTMFDVFVRDALNYRRSTLGLPPVVFPVK